MIINLLFSGAVGFTAGPFNQVGSPNVEALNTKLWTDFRDGLKTKLLIYQI
jgi:hypothetical protein